MKLTMQKVLLSKLTSSNKAFFLNSNHNFAENQKKKTIYSRDIKKEYKIG